MSNLEESLKKAVEEAGGIDKVNGFVLDLRNNPGGLLTQAISVSDAFLDKGEIVSTRGRNPQDSERFNAEPGDLAAGQADGGADQRRLGLGVRDRDRRACRTTTARSSSAPRASARDRCRRSSRCRATARCG